LSLTVAAKNTEFSAMKAIQVTEPFLPPLEEYVKYLEGIWDRNILTNNGPLVKELEGKIQTYHQTSRSISCVANGGLGLQVALRALGIRGEVITTPFTYVATASCPLWDGCQVRFADIEGDYLTLSPDAVEAAITPQTEAIMGVHIFGNPCDVDRLQEIADRHGIALIYDAAQAFGVSYKGKSILDYGDASILSLHATKVLHSVEGGAVVFKEQAAFERAEWMRRYGHNGPEDFYGVGINAKMSELHAAMGLSVLPHLDRVYHARKAIIDQYNSAFADYDEIKFLANDTLERVAVGYAPLIFASESQLLGCMQALERKKIFPRRYFNSNLSTLTAVALSDVPVYHDLRRRILALPINVEFGADPIIDIINNQLLNLV
jgi:dTDP-4-amino-4,6-dideoxygalactose transaminase